MIFLLVFIFCLSSIDISYAALPYIMVPFYITEEEQAERDITHLLTVLKGNDNRAFFWLTTFDVHKVNYLYRQLFSVERLSAQACGGMVEGGSLFFCYKKQIDGFFASDLMRDPHLLGYVIDQKIPRDATSFWDGYATYKQNRQPRRPPIQLNRFSQSAPEILLARKPVKKGAKKKSQYVPKTSMPPIR